ncbi:unnamed protein product [Cochlearia groenlandica]
MGKPERKVRERMCSSSSSSSYFLRCFGMSRKIHADKTTIETCQDNNKIMRSRLFSRQTKSRVKKSEIIPAHVYDKEKLKPIVDDDKQNLFRMIRQVTDQKNISSLGHETKEENTNDQRDINPDPLCFLGYNNTCHDPVKTVGSKEAKGKSSRVRNGSRVRRLDPVIGISVIMITLMIMLMWGRLCAILCTSVWCYILPPLKKAKRKRGGGGKAERGLCAFDLNSKAYKKKVVLEGFLFRQKRVSL